MALSPFQPSAERIVEQTGVETSRTYQLDFDGGRIRGLVDGESAIRQFIRKALATVRYRFIIYDGQYGSEVERIIGADVTDELLRAEVPRLIREALIYDERIATVDNFGFERQHNSDKLYVTFTVTTADGIVIDEGVSIRSGTI